MIVAAEDWCDYPREPEPPPSDFVALVCMFACFLIGVFVGSGIASKFTF